MNTRMLSWRNWGIGARIVFITIIPIVFLFSSILVYAFFTHQSDAKEELAENGRIISTALAESSEYSLISNNFSDIERIASGLIQADPAIYRIEIFDLNKIAVFLAVSKTATAANPATFDAPVRRRLLAINSFDEFDKPHVSGAKQAETSFESDAIIGYVRVTVSQTNMLAKQYHRFIVQAETALLSLLICIPLAILLTRTLTDPLATSIEALQRIRKGEKSISVPITTGGELGDLQTSINAMSLSLEASKQFLEDKISERTKDLEESRNEALRADADKRKLIQKINSIVEEERKIIASELHDELNSSLIATRLNSERILALVAKCEPSAVLGEIKDKSRAIADQIRELYTSSRNIVRKLRPEVIEMLGLNGSIEEIVRHYNQSHLNCQFFFTAEGDYTNLDHTAAIAAYRIVQEALSNVVKHAGATEVSATLRYDDKDMKLHITVRDNGVGFDPDAVTHGIGIIGMKERVYSFNGSMSISSWVGGGTRLKIALAAPKTV